MVKALMCSALVCLAACGDSDQPVRVRFAGEPRACDEQASCLNDGATTFDVAGIRVIHERVVGDPVVTAQVLFDLGAGFSDARLAHAQALLMAMLGYWGAIDYADSWSEQLGRVGAQHWATLAADYAHTGITAPSVHFDQAWHLLAAALLRPAALHVSDTGLDQIKAGYRHGFEVSTDEAPDAAARAGWALIAHAHPYDLRADHLDVLDSVRPSDVVDAWRYFMTRARLTVVVVGDIERERVERLVQTEFGQGATSPFGEVIAIAGSKLPLTDVPPLNVWPSRTKILQYPDSATWHLRGYFPAPAATHEGDYAALMLGARVLSQRLFDEVRIDQALVYSIALQIHNYRANYGTLFLSTAQPALTMLAVRATIEAVLVDGIADDELEAARTGYITDFDQSTQSVIGLTRMLGDWELTSGDRSLADSHIAHVQSVTATAARDALAAGLRDLRIGAAGPGDLDESQLLAEPEGADAGTACLFACSYSTPP
jgi:predicted Zn-dependent peptidase